MSEQNENQDADPKVEDRRDSPRVPMRLKVRWQGGTETFLDRAGDLSLGCL
ncbi:pilus assembly protein PilZ, partial [Corallococcus llansteffanensis]